MTSPVLEVLRTMDSALAEHAVSPVFGLSEEELAEALVLAHRVCGRGNELELRLAAQAASVEMDLKGQWVRATRQAPRRAAARIKLAKALEQREPLRVAMAEGRVDEAQAAVVVQALDRLPTGDEPDALSAVEQAAAQDHLVELCAEHHPDELRRLGWRIFEVVAPDRAETHLARVVEAEYRRGIQTRRLTIRDRGDGTWAIAGVLPAAQAHALRKVLWALASPAHRAITGRAPVVGPARMGEAFCELIDRLGDDVVPRTGGVSARVVVTMGLDDLVDRANRAGVATLDGAVDVPAWVARKTACEAGIIPAVLGARSEILDLGRRRRFHSEAQRLACHRRDVTCRAEGCDWPAWASHLHHPTPWSHGGRTDLTGMSLCPRHHTRAHDPTYEMSTGKNGKVVFRRT